MSELEDFVKKWKKRHKRNPGEIPDVPKSIKSEFGWHRTDDEGRDYIKRFWEAAWQFIHEESFELGVACGFEEAKDTIYKEAFLKGFRSAERLDQEEVMHDAKIYLQAARVLAKQTQGGTPLLESPVATGPIDFPHQTEFVAEAEEVKPKKAKVRSVGG